LDGKKGRGILEPTSGNTGIALAMIGAAKGYRVKLCMPGCVSTERQHILEALGAEVVLTPAREATDGAIRKAHQLVDEESDKYYMPNQFVNENNTLSHYETTAPEIFSQTKGQIDVFVAGMGTTGTLMGVRKFLKEKKPKVRIVGVEPIEGHTIQGLKNMKEAIVPDIYDPDMLDEKITIEDGEAFEATRLLAAKEGIFVGMSSGAAVAAALHVAEKMTSGTIVVILPDRGDRYLSTTLFRSICAKCPP
jgi:cysteine synthase B